MVLSTKKARIYRLQSQKKGRRDKARYGATKESARLRPFSIKCFSLKMGLDFFPSSQKWKEAQLYEMLIEFFQIPHSSSLTIKCLTRSNSFARDLLSFSFMKGVPHILKPLSIGRRNKNFPLIYKKSLCIRLIYPIFLERLSAQKKPNHTYQKF